MQGMLLTNIKQLVNVREDTGPSVWSRNGGTAGYRECLVTH